jgi:hypothetical protein
LMTPVGGEVGRGSGRLAPISEGRHSIRVIAEGLEGVVEDDEIAVRVPRPNGERAILGTRLGPNANGRQW